VPLTIALVAVGDCWDAISEPRPYRAPRSFEDAMLEMQNGAGRLLVMIAEPTTEPNPPTPKVRHSFHVVLREGDDRTVVIDTLTLGPPDSHIERVDEPDRGVTWAALKALRPGVLIAHVVGHIRAEESMIRRLIELDKGLWISKAPRQAELTAVIERFDAALEQPRRRREQARPRLAGLSTDELHRDIAHLCATEYERGRRRGFHNIIATFYGGVPEKTAADWIYKARQNGWLTPVAPGRIDYTRGPRFDQLKEDNDGKTT